MPEALTDGERWTRAELERLRAARFAPPAVARFLAASSRRSAEVRRERPALARQSRRWLAAGAAAYAVTPGLRRRRALAWWAATGLMLDWHLGMFETPAGEPRPLGPADAVTLARAWLVPLAAQRPSAAVAATAGLSDVLDGRLARATAPTRAGRDLEGLVDACFAAAVLRGLAREDRMARGVLAAEGARIGIGLVYSLVASFARAGRPDDDVLHAARATTVVRSAGIVAAASGRRRLGGSLLAAGSAAGVALVSRGRGSRAASRAGSASPAA